MASLLDFFRNIPGFLLNGLTDEVMVPGADPDNIQFPFDNQRKQRVPSKFANVLGEALRRGAVAASTPSVAGGGGFDILRSMVAADDDAMKRQQFGQSMQNGQLDRALRMQQLQNEALWRQSQMENFRQQSEDRDLERERKAKEDEQTALTRQQGEQNKFLGDGGFFLNNAQAPRDYNIPVTPWMLIPKDQATLTPSAPYDPKGSVRMQQTPGFLAGQKKKAQEEAEQASWMDVPVDFPKLGIKKGQKVPPAVFSSLIASLKETRDTSFNEYETALMEAGWDGNGRPTPEQAKKANEIIRQNRSIPRPGVVPWIVQNFDPASTADLIRNGTMVMEDVPQSLRSRVAGELSKDGTTRAKQLTAGQAETVSALRNVSLLGKDAMAALEKVGTLGPGINQARRAAAVIGKDATFLELQARVQAIVAEFRRGLFGTALTQQEKESAAQFLPEIGEATTATALKQRLKLFLDFVESKERAILKRQSSPVVGNKNDSSWSKPPITEDEIRKLLGKGNK